MASKKFVEDFLFVVDHYRFTEAEVLEAKAVARANMAQAEVCYRLMAEEIREARDVVAMVDFIMGIAKAKAEFGEEDLQVSMKRTTYEAAKRRMRHLGLIPDSSHVPQLKTVKLEVIIQEEEQPLERQQA